jgi:hypothetical protein
LRFGDFLKATVLLSAASATLLAALTVIGLQTTQSDTTVYVCFAWWVIATLIGSAMGSRSEMTHAIANLLAGAKHQHTLPELAPARVLANRLWPLLVVTVAAAALSVFAPQIGGIAAGFAIIWALAWRRQESAVAAIEERDGVRFYIEHTSPFRAIRLIRTPGFGGDFLRTPA